MKVRIPEAVNDHYTDILAHSYQPGGYRLAAGTTTGKVIVLQRDEEQNEAFIKMETYLPNGSAVLGLHWARPGIFVSSKSLLYLYSPSEGQDEEEKESQPMVSKFECMFDVQDVSCLAGSPGSTVFGACDDCKVRAWDVETQKLLMEFNDHKMPVEVCRANAEYVCSGGQDGTVMVYDGQLRSPKPVVSFDQGKKMITGLDISPNSTWIAAGSKESPIVYNLKNSATLPQMKVAKPNKIHTVHFDAENTLWWAGGDSLVFKSENLTSISTQMKATYGSGSIHHVYSITTTKQRRMSVAGASTGILFSENSDFWGGMVHI